MIPSFLLRLLQGRDQEPEPENNPREVTNPGLLRDLQEQPDALQMYMSHVQDQPRYDDYKPSIGRRVGGGLIGFLSGLAGNKENIGEDVVQAPYQRALAQHAMKGRGLRQGAEMEIKDERNNIAAVREQNRLSAETSRHQAKMRELDIREALGHDKNAIDRERLAEVMRHNRESEATSRVNADANATRAGAYATTAPVNAEAARTRAEAARINAETYRTTGGRSSDDRVIPPQSQQAAKDMAIDKMIENPEFESWIQEVDGERVINRSAMPPDIRKKFDAMLEAETKRILTTRPRDLRGN